MQVIKKVNIKKKKYFLKEFSELVGFAEGVTVEKNGVSEGFSFYDVGLKFNNNPQAIYYVNGKIYSYDGVLNQLTSEGEQAIITCNDKPVVQEVVYNGKKLTLFMIDEFNSFCLSAESDFISVNLPKIEYSAVLGGRLFGAHNQDIYFTKPFDFDNNATDLRVEGNLRVSSNSGKIVGLAVKERKLYMFCERAVYRLDAIGDSANFRLEKLLLGYVDVKENTVKDVCEQTIFVSGQNIYAFNGKNFKQIAVLPKWLKIDKVGQAVSAQNLYVLPITTKDGKNKYYIYDCDNGSQSVVAFNGGAICDGGYFCAEEKSIKRIDRFGQKKYKGVFKTQPIYMEVLNDKSLLSVNAFVNEDCELRISGDSGTRIIWLKKGANRKRLKFLSKSFSFEFSQIGQGFSLEDFYVEYTIRGE